MTLTDYIVAFGKRKKSFFFFFLKSSFLSFDKNPSLVMWRWCCNLCFKERISTGYCTILCKPRQSVYFLCHLLKGFLHTFFVFLRFLFLGLLSYLPGTERSTFLYSTAASSCQPIVSLACVFYGTWNILFFLKFIT